MTVDPPDTWTGAWDAAPCGYLVLADDGRVLAANREILDDLGRCREEVVGRLRFVDLLSGGGRIYHETHLMPMLRLHGSVAELALDLQHADGRRVPVLVNARRNSPDTGPRTVHVVTFDASRRRDYEREILHAKQRAEASETRALALARTLQATLIPPLPPTIDGLDVAAAYRPAGSGDEVGGDFYDVFQLGADEWVVAIGDVQGKGVAAAAGTALARHVLRAAAVRSRSPREALLTLNEVLRGSDTTHRLTALVMSLVRDAAGWHAVVCSGGHEPPVLRRAGRAAEEWHVPGTMLGVLAAPALTESRLALAPDDLVLLTTDGVHEARDPRTRRFYGVARLLAHVDAAPGAAASAVVESLLADVLAFSADDVRDDVAVVGISVNA